MDLITDSYPPGDDYYLNEKGKKDMSMSREPMMIQPILLNQEKHHEDFPLCQVKVVDKLEDEKLKKHDQDSMFLDIQIKNANTTYEIDLPPFSDCEVIVASGQIVIHRGVKEAVKVDQSQQALLNSSITDSIFAFTTITENARLVFLHQPKNELSKELNSKK